MKSYQLELRHIRYFLAVAEDLHFRRAAERLYISQPGLSRQIKEMEASLGVKLFHRTNRRVSLTKAGQYLKEQLSDYSTGLKQIFSHAKLLHDGLLGELRLAYVGSAMQEIIPSLLLAFRRSNNKILFSLKEMDNGGQLASLLSQEIDIGFVRLENIPDGLNSHPVIKEPFCLVLPRDHHLNASNFVHMKQLREEPFILFDPTYSPAYYQKVMQIFDDSEFSPIVTHNTIHSSTIYKLVEHHFGISIVPRSLISDDHAHVKFLELDKLPQRTTLSAVWHANSRNPVVHDFIKEIKKLKV